MTDARSFPTSLAAAQQSGSRGIELWATDPDGALWTLFQARRGGPWGLWEGPGFKSQPAPAARVAAALRADGNVQLFMLDRWGLIWTIAQFARGGDWGAWQGPAWQGQPTGFVDVAASAAGGGIQVSALDVAGAPWTSAQLGPGEAWSAWQQRRGPGMPSFRRIAAAGQNNGGQMVFALDTSDRVWSSAQANPRAAWGPWTGPGIGGQSFDLLEIAAAQQSGNRGAELWGVGSDGNIWTLFQARPGGPWSPWEGPFRGQPKPARTLAAADQNTGRVMLATRNADNSLGVIAQLSPGGDWGAWSALDGFAGTAGTPQDELLAALVGYFPFDGSAADPVATVPMSATLSGWTGFVPAWGGRAALQAMDATGGCTFPKLPTRPDASGATLAFWFRAGATFTNAPVLYSDANGFHVSLRDANTVNCRMPGTHAACTLTAGRWNHIVLAVKALGASGHVLDVWVNGVRVVAAISGVAVAPARMFASHATGTGPDDSTAGIALAGHVMLGAAVGDETAQYLASDLFHPEATHASEIEYLAARLDGESAIACPDGNGLALTAGYTVTAWISTEMLSYRLYPYSSVEQVLFEASDRCRFFFDESGLLTARYSTPAGPAQSSVDASTLYLDRFDWVHLAFSFHPQQGARLYVNGVAVTTHGTTPKPWRPASPVSIGSCLQQGIYGVTVYGDALTPAQISDDLSLDVPTQGLPANGLVYYDLSAVPPAAISSDAQLAGPLTAPATMVYDVYSAGVALVGDGYVDCGYDVDAVIPAGTSFSLDAWIYPGPADRTMTIVARQQDGRGYRVFLQDGALAAEMHGTKLWQSLLAVCDVPLPSEEWSRVGVVFANEVSNAISLTLFVNGRRLAHVQRATPPGSSGGSIADPQTRLLVGAQWDDAGATGAFNGFNGFVQRLRFYGHSVAFDGVFVGSGWSPGDPVSDWFLGDDFPRDLTDDEPATLLGSASVGTIRWSASPAGAAGLARGRLERAADFREGLFARDNFPDLWDDVRPEHQDAVLTTDATAGQVVSVTRDDATYLLVHGGAAGGAPACYYIGGADDPTADWVGFTIEIVSLGLSVWGLRASGAGTDKLAKTGLSMWRNPAVRASVVALSEVGGASEVPQAFIHVMRAIYSSGFISRLLACYSLSFFTILRFAAMFAPWAAWALIAYDLASIAGRAWDLIRPRRPKQRPSSVNASCAKPRDLTGSVPVLVNGDPVAVTVILSPPPKAAVAVTASAGPLRVTPATLDFPAGSGSRQAMVSAAGPEASAEDGMPVTVTWRGAGVLGEGVVDFRLRVLDLTFHPAEPELEYDVGQDAWVGDFTVEPGPEMASGSTLEVMLSGRAAGDDELTFDPPTLTFSASEARDGPVAGVAKKTTARWKNPPRDTRNRTFGVRAKTVPLGRAGDGLRRSPRLRKAEQYDAKLTLVDAGRGLSMVLRVDQPGGASQYAVIDGGLTGTYPNLASYLPPAGSQIAYVVCTHYDDDHIAGLIVLLTQRVDDVGRVLFNPPPAPRRGESPAVPEPDAVLAAEELPAFLEALERAKEGFLNLYSPQQGWRLQQLAGARLLQPITASPPPATSVAGASLTRTAWRFGGPTAANLASMQGRIFNPEYVNRASLLFVLAALDGGGDPAPGLFSLLVTGDGTNKALRQDVLGFRPLAQDVQFLQVPHHGSNANSDLTLYGRVSARHYLISSRWAPHHHPGSDVIRAIVEGNRLKGRRGYTIWISDPTFRKAGDSDGGLDPLYDGFFPRPVGAEYSVKLKAPHAAGLSFRVSDGAITEPPPAEWTPLLITPR